MAIDPTIITTVRADQLPVAPLTNESIVMHAIGETLYQATVDELIALLPPGNAYKPYETKILYVTDLYVQNNFETSGVNKGLAKPDGLWPGWAIMDGVHDTANMDGAIPLGYGATYNTMRQEVGENNKSVVLPTSGFPVGEATNNPPSGRLIVSSGLDESGEFFESIKKVGNTGAPSITFSIMQKSRVMLYIMFLP